MTGAVVTDTVLAPSSHLAHEVAVDSTDYLRCVPIMHGGLHHTLHVCEHCLNSCSGSRGGHRNTECLLDMVAKKQLR